MESSTWNLPPHRIALFGVSAQFLPEHPLLEIRLGILKTYLDTGRVMLLVAIWGLILRKGLVQDAVDYTINLHGEMKQSKAAADIW